MILERIHGWSLRAQVMVMLGAVGLSSATMIAVLVTGAARTALAGEPVQVVHRTVTVVGLVAGFIALLTVLGSIGAAALLQSSIAHVVSELERATGQIASGGFDHRLGSVRRDELGRLSRAIDAMAARLAELDRSREQLLATVSHELRTPLTVIRGHAFTLARNERDAARRERLAVVDGEVERLARLIDDLLAAATLRAVGVELDAEPVPAGELVRTAAGRFHDVAASRGITLEVRVDTVGMVSVDSARVHQVIGNLLSNAIAHAPNGTQVELRLARPRGRARDLRVTVANAGPGIPRAELESIFEPFTQGPAPTGSVGLGLAIARDLVRAHGRDIAVRSRPGRTEFAFDLPAAGSVVEDAPAVTVSARFAT